MSGAWVGSLLLGAFVVLLAVAWLGSLFFWANRHGPEQRSLYRLMVSTHALDASDRREVEKALAGGTALDSPRLRAAVVDWAGRALERDVELRRNHPRGRAVVALLYVLAALCLAAIALALVLYGQIGWGVRLSLVLDVAIVSQFVARPFVRRRHWQRAIDRNSEAAGRLPAE